MKTYSCTDKPIVIDGLAIADGEKFWRLPPEIHDKVNPGVTTMSRQSSGARVRFSTDSKKLSVKVRIVNDATMPHMPYTGSSGIDVFCNGIFLGNKGPADHTVREYEFECELPGVMSDIKIYLPLYNETGGLWISVDDDARIAEPKPYRFPKPTVFYGSSITQGGCANKPSNCYMAILSRMLDMQYIGLGFSGAGKGEQIVADYIAGLDMGVFVMDYDYNAENAEYLEKTHEPFFRTVRTAQPELPIILVSKPDFDPNNPMDHARRNVIKKTYENALAAGDKKVWFVDGETLWGTDMRESCSTDKVHPNDLGFYRMAKGIEPALREALGI